MDDVAGGGWTSGRMEPPRMTQETSGLAAQTILKDAPDGLEPVLPADLLALVMLPADVRDGAFHYPHAEAGKFGSDFRLEAEAVLFDLHTAQYVPANDFIARL